MRAVEEACSLVLCAMAVPAWKLALQERKKKQEEEEKLKKVKEEEHKLASLPAWKRAIIMREKKGPEPTPGPAAEPGGAVSDGSGSTLTHQRNGPVKPHTEKWQVAVERVKGPDSPILKRAPPSSVQKSNFSAATSNTASENTRSTAQKTVLNRWATGSGSSEAASPRAAKESSNVKRSATFGSSGSTSSFTKPSSSSPSNFRSTTNHSSSPVNNRSTAIRSSSPVSKRPTATNSSSPVSARTTITSNKSSANTLSATSKWHKDTTTKSTPSATGVASKPTSASQTKKEEEDPSLMRLPPWKRALILKKRRSQQNLEVENKPSEGEDETDAGSSLPDTVAEVKGGGSSETGTSTVILKQPTPEVVNRQTENNTAEQRLVQQEGKTLHPPVYKEVDKWANVAEEDEKFLSLPSWKQALIKRRRADIAVRTGQPVTVTPTPTKEPTVTKEFSTTASTDSPKTNKDKPPKKTASSNSKFNKKQATKGADNRKNKASTAAVSTKKTNTQGTSKTRPSSGQKAVRKAPAIPVAKKEEKPEPMFSFDFSHRSLDTGGGSSSDSTDSDVEDAVVTNLDGDSDESDSGIVLQRYSKSSSDLKNNNPLKRNSSILSVPGKKKDRRVSISINLHTLDI